MTILRRSYMLLSVLILTVLFLAINACAPPVKIQKFETPISTQIKFTTEQAGLRISADPYKDDKRLQDHFGCDLLSRGVLPIFILLENLRTEDGYVLVKEKTRLVMMESPTDKQNFKNMETHELQKITDVQERSAPGLLTAASPLFLPLFPVAIGAALVDGRRIWNEQLIRKNMEDKNLTDKTIYPGASHSGFLFFRLNAKEDLRVIRGVSLCVKNVRSNETLVFMIDIKNERSGE